MEGSSNKIFGISAGDDESKEREKRRASDPWGDDVWGDDLPGDVVEQCILLASQTVESTVKEPKTCDKMSALQKAASAHVDRRLVEISLGRAPLPLNVLKKEPYIEPFRKVETKLDVSSLQASGHSLMGRVQEVLKQKPSQKVPEVPQSPQKLTQMQRKLATPTRSLPGPSNSSNQATTDWLRSQLEKSNTECDILKRQIQSKEGESKVLRDKLQMYEKDLIKQKQEKMREIEKIRKQSEDRIKELERKLTVAEIDIMFKNKQTESNMDKFSKISQNVSNSMMKPQNLMDVDQPSTSKTELKQIDSKVSHGTEYGSNEIYEVDTQCSSEDELHKMETANFGDHEILGCTEQLEDDMFESVVVKKKKVEFTIVCDEPSRESLLNKYLLESDDEDDVDSECTEPEDLFLFQLDMGKLLADKISPKIYAPSKVELNFIIAPQVDYDPHTLLYKDFSEVIFDEYSDDPSKKVDIWSENPNYSVNPAIRPHFIKEPKMLMKEFENPSDLIERLMNDEMAQVETELNKSSEVIVAERGTLPKETIVVLEKTLLKEEIKSKDRKFSLKPDKKDKQCGTFAEECGAKSRFFKTLEDVHLPLLKLSKSKVWDDKDMPEINQILDHIKNMGRELFIAVCDPRHLNFINRKNLEMKEKEIASYFNKETHEMDLLSHKALNDREKYVDFRRAISLLAILCNSHNMFGKLLLKHKKSPEGTEPNDLEIWKNNFAKPGKRVHKFMTLVYENMNSAYGTKEIDGKISIISYDKTISDSFQSQNFKNRDLQEKKNIHVTASVLNSQSYFLDNEVGDVTEKFGKLYDESFKIIDESGGDYKNVEGNNFNLWKIIENPESDLQYFINPNGPLLEMMELSKLIETEFREERKDKNDQQNITETSNSMLMGLQDTFDRPGSSKEESFISKSFENENLHQPKPVKKENILEEIINRRLDFWEKSFNYEVDTRFNDEVLPFLEPELYTGDKATEAEKSMAGLVLQHHKTIQDNVKGVMIDVKEKLPNFYDVDGYGNELNKCSTEEEKIKMGNDYESEDATSNTIVHLNKNVTSDNLDTNLGVILGECSKGGGGLREIDSPIFKVPELPTKDSYEGMDIEEEWLESYSDKGKMSKKDIKKGSNKRLKLEQTSCINYSGPSSVSVRSRKIMSLVDPHPSSSDMNRETFECTTNDYIGEANTETNQEERLLPKFLKIPDESRAISFKKISVGKSSRAFLARKREFEHLPDIDENVEEEIEKLFEPKASNAKDKEEENNKGRNDGPKLDCPKRRINILDEYRKFKTKLSSLELLDFVYEIISSIGNLRLTLNFNPLFSSVVELIQSLFNNYIEKYYNDEIDFFMNMLREILYCFPSPSVILQIQVTLVGAIKFERVVHQLCHNPSMKMSYVDGNDLRFYRDVCFLQVFSFLITKLRPHKVKNYWDIVFYMIRWIFGMYTMHLHVVDAKWYRKYTKDKKDSCKCASVFNIMLFKVLSKCSFYYNLYSESEKDMDELTKQKLEEMMLCGINLADMIVSHDPHFASHMKKRYREYAGFLKTMRHMHDDKIIIPPFELSKLDLLLKEEEVIAKIEHDSSRSYDTMESQDSDLAIKHYQEAIFFSEIERVNIFDQKLFRDSLDKCFDST